MNSLILAFTGRLIFTTNFGIFFNEKNINSVIRPYMTGQMSPSGSEDIRTSEGEPDRHYRIDSSVCSESSQG